MNARHLTPRQLAHAYERDEISREEFQRAMLAIQIELLSEAAENRRNPITAYLNERLNKRAVKKLLKSAKEPDLREIFYALGDLPDFPPAKLLWNADQRDIPLHVFLRSREEPVFRITYLSVTQMKVELSIEHGSAKKQHVTREDITLNRTCLGHLKLAERRQRR